MPVTRRLERPDLGHCEASNSWSAGTLGPCSALLRAGFTWPAGHPAAGGLLPHHFTVAADGSAAVSFLWHSPSGHPDWALPSALLCWSPGLSSAANRPRPSGRLAHRVLSSVAPCQRHPHREIPPSVHKRLLLHAGGDGTSARSAVIEHLRGGLRAVMIPYAQSDHDRATARFAEWLNPVGVEITGVHTADDPAAAIGAADAVFVTGGNSFRLVNALHRLGLIVPVREAIERGVPYYGASAGSNVACPTIRTTNDMPIVQPPSSPRSTSCHSRSTRITSIRRRSKPELAETREERLREFLEENDVTVVGLREQSWLEIDGPSMRLVGTGGAVLFRRDREPEQLRGGADLSALLLETPRYDV